MGFALSLCNTKAKLAINAIKKRSNHMDKNTLQCIVSRILERAFEARNEYKETPNDIFQQGRHLAYYEVLDIIKSELDIANENLKVYGLDINFERDFL
jgi:hypothetical protein